MKKYDYPEANITRKKKKKKKDLLALYLYDTSWLVAVALR